MAGSGTARRRAPIVALVLAAGLASLLGSGGGGGGGGAPTTGPTPTPAPTPTPTPTPTPSAGTYYLLGEEGAPVTTAGDTTFADGALPRNRYRLVAVDPAQPTVLSQVEPAGTWGLLTGSPWWLESRRVAQQFADVRPRLRIYVKNDRLYVLDQRPPAGTTPSLRLMSTVSTRDMCRASPVGMRNGQAGWAIDPTDATTGILVFRTPGADAKCGGEDDEFRMLRVTDDATATSSRIEEPWIEIVDASQRITGFVTQVGRTIRRTAADFTGGVDGFTLNGSGRPAWVGLIGAAAPGVMLMLDGAEMRAWPLAGGAAPTTVFTLAAGEEVIGSALAGTQAFYSVTGPSGTRLVRVDVSLQATTLGTLPEPARWLALSSSRVLALGATQLVSVPRAGGALITVVDNRDGFAPVSAFVSGETVAVSMFRSAPSFARRARFIGTDGSNPQDLGNAMYISVQSANPGPTLFDGDQWSKIFQYVMLAQGAPSDLYAAGAQLKLYRIADRTLVTTYGTLPSFPVDYGVFMSSNTTYTDLPSLLQGGQTGWYGGRPLDLILFNAGSPGLTFLTSNVASPP